MRIAIGCDGRALPADLVAALVAAGFIEDPQADEVLCASGSHSCLSLASCDVQLDWLTAPSVDVLSVCTRGAAVGAIVDKCALLEYDYGLTELLDLKVAERRLVVASNARHPGAAARRLRIATRYPRITQSYFARRGREIEVLPMRVPALAVGLGVADGWLGDAEQVLASDREWTTIETVERSSARLVAGRQACALHGALLGELVEKLRGVREPDETA